MNTNYSKYMVWVIILVIGFLIGGNYKSLYYMNENEMSSHEMSEGYVSNTPGMKNSSTSTHSHTELDVTSLKNIPSIQISARKDSMSGYNIKMNVANFIFTPENVGGANVDNQGHAHVYVNGVKLGRSYTDFYHIPADKLSTDTNEIEVTLNANDHSELVANGKHISSRLIINK